MKYIFLTIITLGLGITLSAQIAIGKDTPLEGAILDFENPTTGGIALPKVINLDPATVPGTIYFATEDSKVKIKLASGDLDLNNKNSGTPFDVTADGYDSFSEADNINGTILGADSSTAPGVLVLESTSNALIIPNVLDPVNTIKSPEPGMLAFDTLTNLLCVFDGTKWAYWGENGLASINN